MIGLVLAASFVACSTAALAGGLTEPVAEPGPVVTETPAPPHERPDSPPILKPADAAAAPPLDPARPTN